MDVNNIATEYEKCVSNVLEIARENLKDEELKLVLDNLTKMTTSLLTDKWRSGRKVVRTIFAVKAFPNYPNEYLKISLCIDAMVNLLDDVLDELMTKYERSLHIVEFIKVMSLFFSELSREARSAEIASVMSEYLSKILCVAASEIHYGSRIRETSELDGIIRYSIKCYDYRAMDVDVFFEIPMIKLYGEVKPDLLSLARNFRAVNLILKDYRDIQHDIKNETFTPLVAIYRLGEDKLQRCLRELLDHYYNRSLAIVGRADEEEFRNLFNMLREEMMNWKRDDSDFKHFDNFPSCKL